MNNDLDKILKEIAIVENNNIDYFKSMPSINDVDSHLRLKDCVAITFISIPPKEQRIPGQLYRDYSLNPRNGLPDNIIKELMDEINKTVRS